LAALREFLLYPSACMMLQEITIETLYKE